MFTSLYIHVPFCNAKCDYCAFYSRPGSTQQSRIPYINRLCEELQTGSSKCGILNSIFVGGGTPSILSCREWQTIFHCIHRNFTLSPDLEWTHEANPESLTPELIKTWADNGVNRVSLGVQAFQPEIRMAIGRHGSIDRLPQITMELVQAGIKRYNFDLIFNIPGQTLTQWQQSLEQALSLNPSHISTYALTIEKGSRLANIHTPTPSDKDFIQFWDLTDNILAQNCIRRYEISNFSAPSQECRHNLEIWKGATYLGCGPAATSFDGHNRWTNQPSLQQWLANTPPEMDIIPQKERAAEILAFGMRLVNGWNWTDFQARTGFDPIELRGPQLYKLNQLGLIEMTEDGAKPTRQGLLFNDDVAMELL